jgi:hypothetical protein
MKSSSPPCSLMMTKRSPGGAPNDSIRDLWNASASARFCPPQAFLRVAGVTGLTAIRPRMSGSTDIQRFFTCTSPSAGAGSDTVASSKLSGVGAPTRGFLRRISRDVRSRRSPLQVVATPLETFSQPVKLVPNIADHFGTRPGLLRPGKRPQTIEIALAKVTHISPAGRRSSSFAQLQ